MKIICIVAIICFVSQVHAADCDRACLINAVDNYLAAVVAHDPGRIDIADDVVFVENITRMQPGEGLWVTASSVPANFKIYVPDPVSQQVGFLGVMEENDMPIMIGLRLKLTDGKISEMEHILARKLSENSLSNLQLPRAVFSSEVTIDERDIREDLIRIATSYYDAVNKNDGSLTPFSDHCVRRENGNQTTGNPEPPPGTQGFDTQAAMGCADQLDTQTMSYIDLIDNRRVEIADVKMGLVFGLSHFRHSMKQKFVKLIGIPGVTQREMNYEPFDLPAAHNYKISGGKMHEIEAIGFLTEYNSRTGWE